MKKKVLGILCHPDDEVLFGWPIFQSSKFEKHLIIICDDFARNRPERKRALQEVCKQENINLYHTLPEDNNFYAMPTRRADYVLNQVVTKINFIISDAIRDIKPDYIFIHNPVGEYDHGSHRLLFEIVSQHPLTENILITDICQESNHRSSKEIPQIIRDAYYKTLAIESSSDFELYPVLSTNFYNRCKQIYDKYNAWTWSKAPIRICNLYLLKEENA